MLSISAAVEAASNAIKSVFDFASTAKENQSETEVIKDKRDLKKATNKAEEAFKLFFRYYDALTDADKKKLKKLYDDFLEHN